MNQNQTNEHLQGEVVELRDRIASLQNAQQTCAQNHDVFKKRGGRYRTAVENQAELVCSCLPDATVFFINDSYCKYLQKNRDELIGEKDPVISLSGDKEYMKEKISFLTPGNPVAHYEHEVIFPDGTIHWQEFTTRAIFDDLGLVKEYHTVGRDITERKRIEKKFHQIEGALNILIDVIGEGAFIIDAGERIVAVNNAMSKKLGRETRDIVGTGLCEWLDDNDLRLNREMMDKAVRERAPVRFEYVREELYYENFIYPIVNLTGNVTSLAIITRNITQQKEKEKKLSYLVMNDGNIGLQDLRYLEEITKRVVEYAKKGDRSSLLYLNLTNFGYMNSIVGQNKSDEILIMLSGLLKSRLRMEDIIIRIEKDRFALLLLGATSDDAKFAVQRIQFALESFHFLLDGRIYRLGNSIGLVEIDGTLDAQMVLSKADEASREAHKLGKDSVIVVEGKNVFK